MTRARDISKIVTDADLSGTLDVTGAVTAGGLTMDTGGNSTHILEFGADRTSDSQALGIIRGSWNGTVVSQINLSVGDDTTNKDNGQIFFRTAEAGTTANRLRIEENGDISFYEDTGTTAKFFWDASAECLNVGTATSAGRLHVNVDAASDYPVRFVNSSSTGYGLSVTAGNNNTSIARFEDYAGNDRVHILGNGNVGIGTSSPDRTLSVEKTGGSVIGTFKRTDGPTAFITFEGSTTTTDQYVGIGAVGDDLFLRSGNAETLRIDSSGNVGIGTSSPAATLDVNGTIIATTISSQGARIERNGTTGGANFDSVLSSGSLHFRTGTTERMRITSDGVGINTSSPTSGYMLHVGGSSGVHTKVKIEATTATGQAELDLSADPAGVSYLNLGDEDSYNIGRIGYFHSDNSMRFQTNGSERMRIRSTGKIGLGTSTADAELHIEPVSGGANASILLSNDGRTQYFRIQNNETDDALVFNANDTSERMRIDSSGNLLVGATSYNSDNVGFGMSSSGGVLYATTTAGRTVIFNRRSSDGEIIGIRKDGVEVGRIGSVFTSSASRIFIANSNTGLHFNDGTEQIIPCVATGAKTDNAIDLGNASGRFDQIFSSNANLNTSDRNEKQDIEELSDAEQRVAVRCKSLVRKYRWIDAVSKKGDNARIHVGIIAQDLQDAFTAEGLDASRYSMFCSDTWWEKEISVDAVEADEENGIEAQDAYTYMDEKEEATEGYTERTRLGVRYTELLAFIISAI